MRPRLIAALRLVALVVLEAAALEVLRGHGQAAPGAVDWGHLGRWLAATAPDDAVVAVVRVVAMVLAGWLLATTVLYLLARLTRVPRLVRGASWATLPAVRRLVDASIAVSLIGGAVLGPRPAGAQVPAPPPIVVQLDAPSTAPAHLYVPVPAGDHFAAVTSTPPSIASSSVVSAPPPAPPADLSTTHTYSVVPGDNLWTIAAAELTRQTGRTPDHLAEVEIRSYWLTVIAANRAHLRSGDPNLIYPGEQITCPPVA